MQTPIDGRDSHLLATLLTSHTGAASDQAPSYRALRMPPWSRLRIAAWAAATLHPITIAKPRVAGRPAGAGRAFRLAITRGIGAAAGLALLWLLASAVEWGTGQRLLPWNPYAGCGGSRPASLPPTVRVGLYEEFPVPSRLAKLRYADFPVSLAIAAPSREAFLKLSATIQRAYPQVREVYFWPLLASQEGYYPGTWSDAGALRRVAAEAEGLPVLWDLEMPPDLRHPSIRSWPQNRVWLDQWLSSRAAPVHLWRSHASMGLDPAFLRLVGMHFDPLDYPAVSLHRDLYTTGAGRPREQMARILRCGVERYGRRFIPALGVLDDGHASPDRFVPIETLRRDLRLARSAGVAEVWLFGVNGLSANVVKTLHETLPLDGGAKF